MICSRSPSWAASISLREALFVLAGLACGGIGGGRLWFSTVESASSCSVRDWERWKSRWNKDCFSFASSSSFVFFSSSSLFFCSFLLLLFLSLLFLFLKL